MGSPHVVLTLLLPPQEPVSPLLLSDSSFLWISHEVTSWRPLLTSPKSEREGLLCPPTTCMAPLAAPVQLLLAVVVTPVPTTATDA